MENLLNQVPAEVFDILGEVVAGAVFAIAGTGILKHVKKIGGLVKGREKVLNLIVIALSGLFVAVGHVEATSQFQNWFAVGQTLLTAGSAHWAYTFFVKPLSRALKSRFMDYAARAYAYNEEKRSAIVPDTGVPTGTVGVPQALASSFVENDFSH